MCEMTILHLSDIHFKKKEDEENKIFRQDVQQKLIEAVKVHAKKHGKPQFVAITGDIAFSGKEHEYDESLKFFAKLEEIMPDKTEFLTVPGNHDVDRKKLRKPYSLHQIANANEEEINHFFENEDNINFFINVKFKAYRAFSSKLNPELYKSENDYFWVKKVEDKNVYFLGLNSAWASERDKERFNIALGYPQLIAALEKSKDVSNKIVLMHHPPVNWLADLETGKTRVELFKNCRLLLHGHTHSDNALVFKDPADECICLGANASYTNDKKGFIGFQFVEVDFSSKGTEVKVWPFIFDERRNDFVPDRERWRGQDGKPYFEIDSFEPSKGKVEPPPPVKLEIPADYKKWVEEFHSTLPTDQLARKGEVVMISLPEVYIPIETANPFHKSMDEKRMKEGGGLLWREHLWEGMDKTSDEPKEPSNIDIEELLGRWNCMMLRGKAGMGKTTLIKHLAYGLTHGSGPAALRGHLPVPVFLKDFWIIYREELAKTKAKPAFELLLEVYFKKYNCPLSMETVKGFLAQDRVLFLLDGLDEVPGDIRGDLVDLVHGFQFQHKGNCFLITGRPHGIEGRGMHCFGKKLRDIEPLDDKKADAFISRWFRAVSGQAKGLAEVTANDMISDIRLHEHAGVFTGNPLLLTALCIFYLVGGKRIPDQRADLYDRIVTNLLYRRFHDPADTEQVNRVREFLMLLAFTMQSRQVKSIEPEDVKEVLKQKIAGKEDEPPHEYKKRIDELFDGIEPVCGLLNRLSSGEIEFAHLSFQEFLAAKYMLDMDIDYKKYLEDAWWEETLLLYLGLMNLEMKKRSNGIVQDLLKKREPRFQLLGSRALRDFQPSKREEPAAALAKERLIKIIGVDVSLENRFEAGEILGTLGDPRIQPPPMALVDAGEFTRGPKEIGKEEKPVRRIYLDEFMIGKYPVTNEEFKAFVDDKGYEKEELWTPEGWEFLQEENISEPLLWHDRKWNGPNFPVVGVSWYEADAYAKWLSKTRGDKYALPTEAQWEKAARGTGELVYPWGNEFDKNMCNSDECGLNRTSPVGIFPGGESPYGCMDMAGNVWEWCSDWFGSEYYKESSLRNPQGPENGSNRVRRGGSWFSVAELCASAIRNHARPAGRDDHLGFRLARSL